MVRGIRDGFMTVATSKMELFVIIAINYYPNSSILDVAAVLNPPLGFSLGDSIHRIETSLGNRQCKNEIKIFCSKNYNVMERL